MAGKNYSEEFKKEVVKAVLDERSTIGQAAKDFGVPRETMRNWVTKEKRRRSGNAGRNTAWSSPQLSAPRWTRPRSGGASGRLSEQPTWAPANGHPASFDTASCRCSQTVASPWRKSPGWCRRLLKTDPLGFREN